jgi:hypothetical protein
MSSKKSEDANSDKRIKDFIRKMERDAEKYRKPMTTYKCLSVASLSLSLFSIVLVAIRIRPIQFLSWDVVIFCVSVLSFLTASLISFQIYNYFSVEKRIDGKIESAMDRFTRIAATKDIEGNFTSNLQTMAVLSQETSADSFVTALTNCAFALKKIRLFEKAEVVYIPTEKCELKNFIEAMSITVAKGFFKGASKEKIAHFLQELAGVEGGTHDEMQEFFRLKRAIEDIQTSPENSPGS